METATIAEWRKLLDREDVTKYLPYDYFSHEDRLYINKDGSVGFIIECSPLPMVHGMAYSGIESAVSILPKGATVQCLLFASPDTTKISDQWSADKDMKNDLFREVIENYKNFIDEKKWEPIGPNFQAPIKNYRVIISVKLGGREKEHGIFDKLFSPKLLFNAAKAMASTNSSTMDNTMQIYEKMRKLKERFIGAIKSGNLAPVEMDNVALTKALYPLFNPNHDFRTSPESTNHNISNYLVSNDTKITIEDEYMMIDNIYGKSLAAKEFPKEFCLSETARYAGEFFGRTNFPGPIIISLNVVKLPPSSKSKMKRNASIVMGQQMPYALFPRLKKKHEDLSYGMQRLDEDQDVYDLNFSVFVFADTLQNLNENAGVVKSYFKSLKYTLEEDLYIHFPVLMANLPFGYDLTIGSFLSRSLTVFEENVCDQFPISADWKGNKPSSLFITPRGQLIGWDVFSNDAGGFNAFVIGTTGSGKSVFLQWIALNYLMEGKRIWIIDIGGSYERLIKVFGGQFIELDLQKPISINPFTEITDNEIFTEYLDFLQAWFLLMGSPKEVQLAEQLEKFLKSRLGIAITDSYTRFGSESCVDTVLQCLQLYADDPRIKDFIITMHPYTSEGQYGAFFNGPCEINFKSRLVGMELRKLESIEDLRDPALMLLTFHVSKEIYLKKTDMHVVIMDEGHKFLGNPHIDLFVEQAYRRFRKEGASFWLGTQGFEDLSGGETLSKAGRVIVQNSYWKFFLMQNEVSRNALINSDSFNWSGVEESMLENINPVAGEYGEMMIMSEGIKTKVRLVLDGFLQALFFSNDDIRKKVTELVNSGKTYTEAVKYVQENMI